MEAKSNVSPNLGEKIVHNIQGQASATTDALKKMSSDASAALSDKVQHLISDFNAAIPTMKALGFSVSSFTIGVGLFPEIDATLKGSVKALDLNEIQKMIESKADNKSLKAILEALHTAAKFKEQLTEMGIQGVEIDIKLGLPPLVSINLLAS
jgi:hypothetical protein